jgi:hypothetical protein
MANGETVTFPSVPSGYRLEVAVTRVLTATTADKIVALE